MRGAIWPHSVGWVHDRGIDDDNVAPIEQPLATQEDTMAVPAVDSASTRTQATNGTLAAANDPAVAGGINEDDSKYEEGGGFGAGLYDTRNTFGELNCYLMLLNVWHLWCKGHPMAFNRYRHCGQILS